MAVRFVFPDYGVLHLIEHDQTEDDLHFASADPEAIADFLVDVGIDTDIILHSDMSKGTEKGFMTDTGPIDLLNSAMRLVTPEGEEYKDYEAPK